METAFFHKKTPTFDMGKYELVGEYGFFKPFGAKAMG